MISVEHIVEKLKLYAVPYTLNAIIANFWGIDNHMENLYADFIWPADMPEGMRQFLRSTHRCILSCF